MMQANRVPDTAETPAQEALSARQSEIADMVVRGHSSREIAEKLFLSTRTVENHLAAIFNKLGVRSRVELVTTLLRRGSETAAVAAAVAAIDEEQLATRSARTNLPFERTSLVGRDREITDIVRMLRENRLVTVTGAGGVGKTRAALAVGGALLDGTKAGVWLAELAPVARGAFVASTVARALRAVESPTLPLVETLLDHLKEKSLLLVLDNCEHVMAEVTALASALLRGCPHVRILATSREPLRIDGERTYRLPSLRFPMPQDARGLTAAEAGAYPAVTLFAERAQAVERDFALSDETAPIVADICRRLDGIPLAIELAASRANMLTPHQMRERLNERFRLVTGGTRDALARHQTLRALIDWSHELLDESERTLFRRLGIFANGFTLEGAVAVTEREGIDRFLIYDLLASLVDKSLVVAEANGQALRYRLFESTRAYANEKLESSGERELLASRRLRYLSDRFAQLRAGVERTARAAEFTDQLAAELEDVRSALDGASGGEDLYVRAELLAEIATGWRAVGFSSEGIRRIETCLAELPADASLLFARLSTALALLLEDSGCHERAFDIGFQAIAHARAASDGSVLAAALVRFAFIAAERGRTDEAEAALTEAESIPHVSAALRLKSLASRAALRSGRGDVDAEARLYEQIRSEYRTLGDSRGEQGYTINLAVLEHERGRTDRALALIREILPAIRLGRDTRLVVHALLNLTGFLLSKNERCEAEAAAREVLEILASFDPASCFAALAVENAACVYALRNDLARAATLAGFADSVLQKLGYRRDFSDRTTNARLAATLHRRLTPAELEPLREAGAALAPEAALALALE
jgi:predicted ATPase/DNA-binding CsgD family transcriptional regulator